MLVLAVLLISLASAYSAAANAQISDNLVRIGVLGDLSGVYADFGGPGDVVAARMAVEDVGGKVLGKPIDVVAADHQSKADIGAAIARQWFDADKVDMAIGFDCSISGRKRWGHVVLRHRRLYLWSFFGG